MKTIKASEIEEGKIYYATSGLDKEQKFFVAKIEDNWYDGERNMTLIRHNGTQFKRMFKMEHQIGWIKFREY